MQGGTVNVVGGNQINTSKFPLRPALNNIRLTALFFHLKRCSAMQRHQVGIFTDLLCPDVGFPDQPFRTDNAVAGSTRQQVVTSNAGCEFASRVISTGFN